MIICAIISDNDSDCLEEKINNFFDEIGIEFYKILHVKYSISKSGENVIYSAMIIYRG